MLNILMAIVTVLLFLGFISDFILFGVFSMIGNDVGVIVCCFIFVLYLGFILGCVYFYNLGKCDKFEEEKKYLKNDISHLNDEIKWQEQRIEAYRKLDDYVEEHHNFEAKQRELEDENKKLRSIIQTQNGVKTEDLDQYLKVIMEDKNEKHN